MAVPLPHFVTKNLHTDVLRTTKELFAGMYRSSFVFFGDLL